MPNDEMMFLSELARLRRREPRPAESHPGPRPACPPPRGLGRGRPAWRRVSAASACVSQCIPFAQVPAQEPEHPQRAGQPERRLGRAPTPSARSSAARRLACSRLQPLGPPIVAPVRAVPARPVPPGPGTTPRDGASSSSSSLLAAKLVQSELADGLQHEVARLAVPGSARRSRFASTSAATPSRRGAAACRWRRVVRSLSPCHPRPYRPRPPPA